MHYAEHEPRGAKFVILAGLGTSLFGGPLFAIAAPWHWIVKVLLTIVTPIAILAQWVLFTWQSLETHGLKLD